MAKEQQHSEETIVTDKKTSRRGLLKKAVIGAPIALTLAHRPAFAANCSISGFQSVNPSGVAQSAGNGCGGEWPSYWRNVNNRNDWLTIGYHQNPRSGQNPADPAATTFFEIFARIPSGGYSNTTLHDALSINGLTKHAAANFLNASFIAGYRLLAADVIGLYQASVDLSPTYTTAASGTVVNMDNINLTTFFKQYG